MPSVSSCLLPLLPVVNGRWITDPEQSDIEMENSY